LPYLEALNLKKGQRILLVLGNFEQDTPFHPAFVDVEKKANNYGIAFIAVSFEQFLQAIQLPYLSKNLVDAVSDLGEYFDENTLLPSWKYRLDVINCKVSFQSVLQHKIYSCPAQGGGYSHRRSLYFGTYRNKCVEHIAKIEAIVDLDSEIDSSTLIWSNNSEVSRNNSETEQGLIKTAMERYKQAGGSFYPARVFILGDLFPTNFQKVSPGGMQVSKQYFDISKLKVVDAKDLAAKLNIRTWDNYESPIV